jgi:hypothetical protein
MKTNELTKGLGLTIAKERRSYGTGGYIHSENHQTEVFTKEVLNKFKVPAKEQQEFLQLVSPLKSVIVEKK